MHDYPAVSPAFLDALQGLVEGGELAFERHGDALSTYELHGVLKEVAPSGMLRILRTRSHEGEVHSMAAHRILKVATPDGRVLVHPAARQLLDEWRQKEAGRQSALAAVRSGDATPAAVDSTPAVVDADVYQVKHPLNPELKFLASARSEAGLQRVMTGYLLRMKVHELAAVALQEGYDRPHYWKTTPGNAHAGRVRAHLTGLPSRVLQALVEFCWENRSGVMMAGPGWVPNTAVVDPLLRGGLLQRSPSPTTREALQTVSIKDIRQLLKELGSPAKSTRSAPLQEALMAFMTPALETRVLRLSRHPLYVLVPPEGVPVADFSQCVVDVWHLVMDGYNMARFS